MIISGQRILTHEDLQARGAMVASGFRQLGVGEGDAIAILLRNDFTFFEASIGAAIIGAYAVLINWHFKSIEVAHILNDCNAGILVVHTDLLPGIENSIPTNIEVLVVPTPPEIIYAYGLSPFFSQVQAGRVNWHTWLEEQEPWNEAPRRPKSNIIYTSGTTGTVKGVVRNAQTPLESMRFAEILQTVFDIEKHRPVRTVITGPVYHSAPNAYALLAAKYGGTVVLQPRFDAREILELIDRHRITHLHMVPTMFVRLLALPANVKSAYDLSSLEFVVHAAAPCAPPVKKQMIDWWGPIINEYYGSTEAGPAVFHTSEEAKRKPGTVGRPINGATVRILNNEGQECLPCEAGEIYVWISGYSDFNYNNQDEKRRSIERDGLITVGDIGYLDEDGYLFICDRATDMVISGGVNIYPAEIEAALITMPGVRDCAVFGIPDDEFGESLAAHIEAEIDGILDVAAIRSWLTVRLAEYKVPKHIVFSKALPREDSGKILKRVLRDTYWRNAKRKV